MPVHTASPSSIQLLKFLLLPALLSGCASGYVPPAGEDAATITFRLTSRTPPASVFAFQSRQCDDAKLIGFVANGSGQPDGDRVTTRVPAGKEFVATYRAFSNTAPYNYSCQATLAFVPEKGVHYVASYDFGITSQRCVVNVSRADATVGSQSIASAAPPQCRF